jgi:endonuclease/exonuclease/phosphatase (EEP) superfamily protein YafD
VKDWWGIGGSLVSAGLNLWVIAPWFIGRRSTGVAGSQRLELLFANVYRLNTAHDKLMALIDRRHPDLIIVQEIDDVWASALKALGQGYPFCEAHPRGGGSGLALYSRYPFESLPLTLTEGDLRPGILIKLNFKDATVFLLSIHPRAPIREGNFDRRNKMLVAAAGYLRSFPSPKICVGDLNTSLWSPHYRKFEKETNLINARKGFGLLPSWPTFMIFRWLMIPIDHCLVSKDIRVVSAETGEPIDSDHLPLIIELEIPTLAEKPNREREN